MCINELHFFNWQKTGQIKQPPSYLVSLKKVKIIQIKFFIMKTALHHPLLVFVFIFSRIINLLSCLAKLCFNNQYPTADSATCARSIAAQTPSAPFHKQQTSRKNGVTASGSKYVSRFAFLHCVDAKKNGTKTRLKPVNGIIRNR